VLFFRTCTRVGREIKKGRRCRLCRCENQKTLLTDEEQVVCNLCSSGVLEQLWHGTASSLQVSVATHDVQGDPREPDIF